MTASSDWRGEDKIKIKTSKKQKHGETSRLVNLIYHRQRREENAPPAGARKHRAIVLSAISNKE